MNGQRLKQQWTAEQLKKAKQLRAALEGLKKDKDFNRKIADVFVTNLLQEKRLSLIITQPQKNDLVLRLTKDVHDKFDPPLVDIIVDTIVAGNNEPVNPSRYFNLGNHKITDEHVRLIKFLTTQFLKAQNLYNGDRDYKKVREIRTQVNVALQNVYFALQRSFEDHLIALGVTTPKLP